jgi:hypothetical protein
MAQWCNLAMPGQAENAGLQAQRADSVLIAAFETEKVWQHLK